MMLNYVTEKLFFIYIYSRTKKRVRLQGGQGQSKPIRRSKDKSTWKNVPQILTLGVIKITEKHPKSFLSISNSSLNLDPEVDLVTGAHLLEFLFLFSPCKFFFRLDSELHSLLIFSCLVCFACFAFYCIAVLVYCCSLNSTIRYRRNVSLSFYYFTLTPSVQSIQSATNL